jgi:hypothetical protein
MIIHHTTPRCLPALAAAALSVSACDAKTDGDYRGEALFSLDGKIENHRVLTPDGVNVYVVWASPDDRPDVAERVAIEATLPATFGLDVFTPPPLPPDSDFDHPLPRWWSRMTHGHIVAATSDAELDPYAYLVFPVSDRGRGILGVDPRHMIYYMPDGVPEGSAGASLLHGAVTPGFHVFDVKCIGPAKAAEIEACLARYRAEGGPDDAAFVMAACGSYDPTVSWLQPAPQDLQTQFTVELLDDLASYQPAPAECL